jgi:hypothetical protein
LIPSTLERGRRIMSSRPAQEKVAKPYLKNKMKIKRWGNKLSYKVLS